MRYPILCFVPKNNLRRWTELAIDCYNRHCICRGCVFQNIGCRMKSTVLGLVRTIGVPKEEEK